MKIEELRIGNNVYFNAKHKEVGTVTAISKEQKSELDMVYLNSRIDIYYLVDELQPIILNESSIKKLGFSKIFESDLAIRFEYPLDYSFGFDINKVERSIIDGVSYAENHYPTVKYVHDLQNFYFALTRKELIFKAK